jgi:hypothetical protein
MFVLTTIIYEWREYPLISSAAIRIVSPHADGDVIDANFQNRQKLCRNRY